MDKVYIFSSLVLWNCQFDLIDWVTGNYNEITTLIILYDREIYFIVTDWELANYVIVYSQFAKFLSTFVDTSHHST